MTDQVTPVGLVWGEVEERLNGYTCLWQDLDGLHVTGPPQSAPPTSILWAWPTGASAMSEPPAPFDEWDPQHSLVGDESAPAGSQPSWAWEPAIVEFDPPCCGSGSTATTPSWLSASRAGWLPLSLGVMSVKSTGFMLRLTPELRMSQLMQRLIV